MITKHRWKVIVAAALSTLPAVAGDIPEALTGPPLIEYARAQLIEMRNEREALQEAVAATKFRAAEVQQSGRETLAAYESVGSAYRSFGKTADRLVAFDRDHPEWKTNELDMRLRLAESLKKADEEDDNPFTSACKVVYKHVVAPPVNLVTHTVERTVGIVASTVKNAVNLVPAVCTGDWPKAGRKALGLVNNALDTALTPVDGLSGVIGAVSEMAPVLTPFRQAFEEAPDARLLFGKDYNGGTIFYLNGIGTSQHDASEDAKAISIKVQRPVQLIYVPTHGKAGDTVSRGVERAVGFLPMFTSGPERQVVYAIHHNEHCVCFSFSGGGIVVNNALTRAAQVGLADRVHNGVYFIASGVPFTAAEMTTAPKYFLPVAGSEDVVGELVGARLWRDGIKGDRGHQVQSYANDLVHLLQNI